MFLVFKLMILIENDIILKNYVGFNLCLSIISQFCSDNLIKLSFLRI